MILIFILLTLFAQANSFTNIFGELFNDLRFGTFESVLTDQRLPTKKLKCSEGSFTYNGSCYFISDKRSNENEQTKLFRNIIDIIEQKQNLNVIKLISKSEDKFQLPVKSTWTNAKLNCNFLNEYSELVQFNQSHSEFEFIVNLLKGFNIQKNSLYEEQKYWIGLSYIDSTFKWISRIPLNNQNIHRLIEKDDFNYRPCAFINVRDNGEVRIEWSNCNKVELPYICKYVLDRCYNNSYCGKRGTCVNIPSEQSFECRCRLFYEGPRCQTWSNQGIQMLFAVTIIISAFIYTIINRVSNRIDQKIANDRVKVFRRLDDYKRYVQQDPNRDATKSFLNKIRKRYSIQKSEKSSAKFLSEIIRKKFKIILLLIVSLIASVCLVLLISFIRHKVVHYKIEKYKKKMLNQQAVIPKDRLANFVDFLTLDVCNVMNSYIFEDYFLIILSLMVTLVIYIKNLFRFRRSQNESCTRPRMSSQSSINSDRKSKILNYLGLNNTCNCTLCGLECECSIDIPVPMNPFSKRNRFLTGLIYAAYTYNILKIFESLIIGNTPTQAFIQGKNALKGFNLTRNFTLTNIQSQFYNTTDSFKNSVETGILMQLLKQILSVFIIGLRYYPIILCVELKRKSKFCYTICTLYAAFLLFYYAYMNTFCLFSSNSALKQTYQQISQENDLISSLARRLPPLTMKIESNQTRSERSIKSWILNQTNSTNPRRHHSFANNLMYEKFLFYTVLCLIVFYMITELIILLCSRKNKNKGLDMSGFDEKVKNELKYTKELFRRQKPVSYIEYLIGKYIYKNRPNFRFSKQVINTNLIGFVLLYYITSLIIRKSTQIMSPSGNFFIIMVNFLFKFNSAMENNYMLPTQEELNDIIKKIYSQIGFYTKIACLITTCVYSVQLLMGIKNYQKHILNGYRGVYEEIPSPKKFSNVKLAAASLHYSGYAIGYLLWGYLILFEATLVIMIIILFIYQLNFVAENMLKVAMPILTIYFLKRIVIWYLCSYFVTGNNSFNHRLTLKNRKFYFVLNHFNFFFDCFIGSFVCLMRMFKSSLAALFFMPRLDYSIFGRFLEYKDAGFISYVSFLHLEINQSHPVKLAFCELIRQNGPNRKYIGSKTMRNKWFVVYTLIKNPSVRQNRKGFLFKQSLVPKFEPFGHFLRRQRHRIDKTRRRSLSVPSLNDKF